MKSLFKTVALITIFSIITRILGFVFRIILSRIVGAEGVGLYQVASSVFMVLLTIISSGIPLIISRTSANFYASKEKKKQGSFLSVALIFTLALSIVISLIVFAGKDFFAKLFEYKPTVNLLLALLPSLVFSSVYCVLRGDLWGRGNYFALCVTETYEQIIRMVLALLVISSSLSAFENALNLSMTMSIACFFSMLLVIVLFFIYGGNLNKPRKEYFKPFVAQSTPISFMRVAGSFLQPIIAFIVPARLSAIGYTSSQAIALYGVAMGMTMPLLFIPTTLIGSLSTALVPDLSTAIAQNNQSHIQKRITFSMSFSLLISSIFVPMFLGMGEHIGLFLYDNILSGSLLQSGAFILLPLGLTNMTSTLVNSLGLEKKSFKNFLIGALGMILAIIFLPSLIGINALVWGLGTNYIIVFLLNFKLLKKHTKIEMNFAKITCKYMFAIIPAGALTAFVVGLSEHVFPLFITLIIGGVTSVMSFGLLASVMNLIDIKKMFVNGKEKIKKLKLKENKR